MRGLDQVIINNPGSLEIIAKQEASLVVMIRA